MGAVALFRRSRKIPAPPSGGRLTSTVSYAVDMQPKRRISDDVTADRAAIRSGDGRGDRAGGRSCAHRPATDPLNPAANVGAPTQSLRRQTGSTARVHERRKDGRLRDPG